jgi:hypothetical protein
MADGKSQYGAKCMVKLYIIISCLWSVSYAQILDTVSIDENQYDQIMPYLVANNGIKGLNLNRTFQRGDTVVYWLLVADTIGRGVTIGINRLPRLRFNVPFIMRAYGLNRVDSVLGSHVQLFDPLWRPLIRDSLLIIRILQDTVLPFKGYRAKKKKIEYSEIIVENSNGIEIEVIDMPLEAIKPD